MAHKTLDRILDTTATTGTGPYTLAGTIILSGEGGFKPFNAVMAVNDTFFGCLRHDALNEWVTGLWTYTAANEITLSTRLQTSAAGNAAVSFSAGAKTVFISQVGDVFAGSLQGSATIDFGPPPGMDITPVTTVTVPLARIAGRAFAVVSLRTETGDHSYDENLVEEIDVRAIVRTNAIEIVGRTRNKPLTGQWGVDYFYVP